MIDVCKYNENGEHEQCVGLTKSWVNTRQDVKRLCDALGIKLSA